MGGGRAEGLSGIGDGGQAAISLTPDADEMHVHILGSSQLEVLYVENLLYSCFYCCSVTQSCPPLCDPMACSTPGLPDPHHLPHCIGDAIQPSHPLTHSSPLALNLFQHQGFFQ